MIKQFVNRVNELQFLEKEFNKNTSSLVVIYGRRRIGKTALIKKFIQNKNSVYFLATEEMENENKRSLQRMISEFTNNPLLKGESVFSWDDLFTVLKEHNKNEKKVIVIDEFQYLCKINKAFSSIFQRIWDNILKDENIMVILCGSLINMMETHTLSYSSPLYGRRTGQIKMKQISFLHYNEFFKEKTYDELIKFYAVTGGVPKYIELFEDNEDIFDAIENNILNKQSFLYEEPVFLLEKEVSEIGSYFSIIKTIAAGNHKIGKIASSLGVNQTSLTKYISTLINLDILERQVPITESNPEKSKMGLYFIRDNFIEFWFKFVYPYRSYIEIDDIEYVMRRIKANFVHNHVSYVYEQVSMEEMWNMSKKGELPFRILKSGRWWNKAQEIDIVAFNEESNEIIFGECKYLENKVDVDILYKLIEKSKEVNWNKGKRKEYFILFSRKGFTNALIEAGERRKDIILVSGER